MTSFKLGDIDYKNNLFEHPGLSWIILGEPITASLITLFAKVRDSAGTIQTKLGGGAHGHLGFVCSPDNSIYRRTICLGQVRVMDSL